MEDYNTFSTLPDIGYYSDAEGLHFDDIVNIFQWFPYELNVVLWKCGCKRHKADSQGSSVVNSGPHLLLTPLVATLRLSKKSTVFFNFKNRR